jgi:predicted acylesterase/phospholipase RssA
MLASASQPVIFPLVETLDDHQQYCDGGVLEVVPIKLAIALGAEIVDVIVLSPADDAPQSIVYTTFHETIARTLDLMVTSATMADLAHAQFINEALCTLQAHAPEVLQMPPFAGKRCFQEHIIRPAVELTANSMVFEPEAMQAMMAAGRLTAVAAMKEW